MDETAHASRETGRAAAPLAWGLAVVAILGLAPTLALSVRNGSFDEEPLFIPIAAMMITGYSVVGAVLASRQPRNPIGWLMLAIGVLFLLTGLSDEYLQFVYAAGESTNPLGPIVGLITGVLWLPMIAIVSLLVLLFPTGDVPGPRWRPLPWIIGGATVVFFAGYVLHPGPLGDLGVEGVTIENPVGVDALEQVTEALLTIGSVVALLGILPCLAAIVVRFRRSRGEERQQIRWLVYVAGAVVVLALAQVALAVALGGEAFTRSVFDDVLFVASFAALGLGVPAAMGVAVLRYRLYDLDLVIKKTIVFGTLVAIVMLVSLGVLVVASAVFTDLSRAETQVVGLAMLLVGIAVWPLWRFARKVADRVVYGGRATPYEVLTAFSHRVGETYSADDVLPRMAELLADATGASAARVWLRVGDRFRPVAVWPADAPAPADADDLTSVARSERSRGMTEVRDRGEVLGALSVDMPASDPMSPSKQRIVEDLAAQAGLLLRNVRLIEELRESRRRIVSAQDDRAKALERNIHDGAQQQLVALGIKARLARSIAERDPPKVVAMLEELEADAQAALEDLRDLARGIYPPLLADRGLVAALEAQARKSPVDVRIEADGLGRYGPDLESSVYFSVLEALQNVAKYADASSVDVALGTADGEVWFAVTDDGRGFDPSTSKLGTGLQGIVDRVSALGGTVEVRSAPGEGTTISGRVPGAG
ncbi:MAG: histidine kinase [Thermoleophilia bacterium]|nr:histidine kinase [Thermoleophilia bacterium]